MNRNNLIDFLRIIAILGVFLIHYTDKSIISENAILKNFIDHGKYGVILFFVISGYVISKISINYNFPEFIFSRFFRILIPAYIILFILKPTYFFYTFQNCLDLLRTGNLNLIPWFFSLSTKPECLANPAPSIQWTLAVELQYYLFYGLTIFFLIKNYNKINKKWIIILLMIMIIFIFLISMRPIYDDLIISFFNEEIFRYRNNIFVTHLDSFFLGFIALFISQKLKIKILKPKITIIFLIIIFFCSCLLLYLGETFLSKTLIAFNSFIALIICITDNFVSKSKILNNSFVGLIGRSTYVFYLIHIMVKKEIEIFIANLFGSNLAWQIELFLIFNFLIILSIVIYLIIDKPIQIALKKKLKKIIFNNLVKKKIFFKILINLKKFMVGLVGYAPTTPAMSMQYSTIELQSLFNLKLLRFLQPFSLHQKIALGCYL